MDNDLLKLQQLKKILITDSFFHLLDTLIIYILNTIKFLKEISSHLTRFDFTDNFYSDLCSFQRNIGNYT